MILDLKILTSLRREVALCSADAKGDKLNSQYSILSIYCVQDTVHYGMGEDARDTDTDPTVLALYWGKNTKEQRAVI